MIAKASVNRPVLTTIIFLIVILIGAVSFQRLPIDFMPAVEYPTITGSYPTDAHAINVAVFSESAIQQVLARKRDAPYRIQK